MGWSLVLIIYSARARGLNKGSIKRDDGLWLYQTVAYRSAGCTVVLLSFFIIKKIKISMKRFFFFCFLLLLHFKGCSLAI